MKITIYENPMPAVRMTNKTMWYGLGKKYVTYKQVLAQQLNLHLMASNVKGTKMEVTDKFNKTNLPLTKILSLKAKFYRQDNRRCDLDNLLKMAMDLLQTAKVIYNDDQIRKIEAELIKGDSNPRFELELI